LHRKKLIVTGPTASGKSDLSIELAGDVFEVVSADSVQVYRYMDIGSCKPSLAEREQVPHHMIDIVDPDYQFTAGDYCNGASDVCVEIYKRARIPMFVGGAGLYIDSFFFGISGIPDIPGHVKGGLIEEIEQKGPAVLYEELMLADPLFASRIHMNDRQRIVRGLEVFRWTGRTISSFHNEKVTFSGDDNLFIGIHRERDELHRRIDARVDRMIELGLVDEVVKLRGMGYGSDLNSMKSIGYQEMNDCLDGKTDLESAIAGIKVNTKKYAKKQMTWFKRNSAITWFMPSETREIKNKIDKWLNTNK